MNLHPALASFPVALLVLVFLLELLQFWRPSTELRSVISVVLWLASSALVLTFLSGYQAQSSLPEISQYKGDKITAHHQLGRILLFTLIPCALLNLAAARARLAVHYFRSAYLIFLLLSVIIVALVSYKGGELVFRYAIGVSSS